MRRRRTYRHLPVLSSFTVIVIFYDKRSRCEVLGNEAVVALGFPLTYRAILSSDLSSDLAVFNDVSALGRRVSQNPEFLPALWNSVLRFKKDFTKLPGRCNPSLTDVLHFQDSCCKNIMLLLKIIWNVSCIRPSRTRSFCRSGSSQTRIAQRAVNSSWARSPIFLPKDGVLLSANFLAYSYRPTLTLLLLDAYSYTPTLRRRVRINVIASMLLCTASVALRAAASIFR
jgi:hypothetical protein